MSANAPLQNHFALEWVALQNNFERYELYALVLKLAAILIAVAGLVLNLPAVLIGTVVVLLWLQEGIFKSYQSRLGQRLLRLEVCLAQAQAACDLASALPQGKHVAFQLHSEWLAARPGTLGLLREYALSACRPTVAYPYAVVVLGLLALTVFTQVR